MKTNDTSALRHVLYRAMLVALGVGAMLTFINQFEQIINFEPLNIWKTGLSFFVPFCVSALSAITERRT